MIIMNEKNYNYKKCWSLKISECYIICIDKYRSNKIYALLHVFFVTTINDLLFKNYKLSIIKISNMFYLDILLYKYYYL